MGLKFFAGAVVIAASAWTFSELRDETVVLDRPIEDAATSSVRVAVSEPDVTSTSSSTADTSVAADTTVTRPPSVRLDMDFASQAPLGNWDPPYDEACEEASLIIVHHYLENTPLDASIMNRDILAMVEHEESKGLPIDIDMLELAQVARDVYGYDAQVLEGSDVTAERIEQELARGNPVIAPFAGRDLGNPYYSGEGPPYHVLVIVGYDRNNFITHDVGTKRGAYYAYDKDVLMAAIHDWTGSTETIRSGPRRLLLVQK